MPPVQIPAAPKLVTMKQYRIPGGHEEVSQTIKDLLDEEVLKPTTTAWNNPVRPVKKSDGSWRMTVDFKVLNKHTPLTAAVTNIISLIQRVQKHPGIWYAITYLANTLFSVPIAEEHWDQFAFTWQERQYTFTRLPQGWLHSPTICHHSG